MKFRGKYPVNIEYENNKQKMEILITERTDITLLLAMDRIKTFKVRIGRIQLAETNQNVRKYSISSRTYLKTTKQKKILKKIQL